MRFRLPWRTLTDSLVRTDEIAALQALWELEQEHLEGLRRGEKELHYLRKHLPFRPQVERHMRALDRMTPSVRGRVLEWGCRHAPDSAVLRMRLGDSVELHGADVRDGDLFKPFHAFSGLQYERLSDPVELPYPDEYFDTIIAHGVLEHVPSPLASLTELHRVLAVDGTLLIDSLPNRYSYTEAWHRARRASAHEHRYTAAQIRAALEERGFAVVNLARVEMAPMMLKDHGAKTQAAYERVARPVAMLSHALERTPLSLFATSLCVRARRLG